MIAIRHYLISTSLIGAFASVATPVAANPIQSSPTAMTAEPAPVEPPVIARQQKCVADLKIPIKLPETSVDSRIPINHCIIKAGDDLFEALVGNEGQLYKKHPLDMNRSIAILSYKKAEAVWPILTEWAKDEFEIPREQFIEKMALKSGVSFRPGQNMVSIQKDQKINWPSIRSYSLALQKTNHTNDARKLLDAVKNHIISGQKPGKTLDYREQELLSFVIMAQMRLEYTEQQQDTVIKIYNDALQNGMITDQGFKTNLAMNAAAHLAEFGNSKLSTEILDQATADYLSSNSGEQIEGSERHFAWIKACNLVNQGQHIEAQKYYAIIDASKEKLASDWANYYSLYDTSSIRMRLQRCTGEPESINFKPLGGLIPLNGYEVIFQSGVKYRRLKDVQLVQKLGNDPNLQQWKSEFRQLPPELLAPLNYWK